MKNISSALLYGIVRLYAFLPLPALFFFSDVFLYPLVYYVARYRLKVVRKNLRNSFPEKTEKELHHIERKFYRHFCDSFQETIRILGMSEKEAKKRMVFKKSGAGNGFCPKRARRPFGFGTLWELGISAFSFYVYAQI